MPVMRVSVTKKSPHRAICEIFRDRFFPVFTLFHPNPFQATSFMFRSHFTASLPFFSLSPDPKWEKLNGNKFDAKKKNSREKKNANGGRKFGKKNLSKKSLKADGARKKVPHAVENGLLVREKTFIYA